MIKLDEHMIISHFVLLFKQIIYIGWQLSFFSILNHQVGHLQFSFVDI